jgi:hypothetical protein
MRCHYTVLICFCAITSSTLCMAMGDELAQSAAAIQSRIKEEGASSVITGLWGTTAWSQLTDKVASGDAAWIDVAVALSKGSDAGSTSELHDALSLSLAKNPEYVLKVLPKNSSEPCSLSRVCEGPDDPPETLSAAMKELKNAEAAVQQIHGKALQANKRQCLENLKAGEQQVKRFFGVSKGAE